MESNKQEKKDLLKDNPVAKVASGGSWMSKHISSPLAMGKAYSMAPKMESPIEKELVGGQKNLPEGLKKAIEASPAKFTDPVKDKKKEDKKPKEKPKASKLQQRKNFEKRVDKSFISDVKNKGFVTAVKENFKF